MQFQCGSIKTKKPKSTPVSCLFMASYVRSLMTSSSEVI